MPKTVVPDLTPRLEAAGKAVADARNHLESERELLRLAVHDAAQEGMSYRAIARAIRGSVALVGKLLGTGDRAEQ